MSKYAQISDDIFNIFGTTAWKLENIKTFPENFTKTDSVREFIRVSVITSSISVGVSTGVLQIDIFIEAGLGPNRAYFIADKLDKYLASKIITTINDYSTQLFSSSLATIGVDSANPSLQRYKYTIPFNYFGV